MQETARKIVRDYFKKTYEEVKTTGMTFGEAIQAVKNGERCARSNWNGKVQYIELATSVSYINAKGDGINVDTIPWAIRPLLLWAIRACSLAGLLARRICLVMIGTS